ncbi:sodium/hydrogen exchanger [Eremomyces bilateralis CBS 781.70]|uniref:Sodium/hydrogen exchanger n=1 Tax=Eremomyces bilateralis CBS 781.70 TaxID=1392243 RepID=A0A6G1G5E9_9PEZI|nr:sodium/hydrogen exchanger [Eremomyces bilateralis CBS 781.70]KAF1813283.1 sodium/hydrogen exchanger [Eremomyces bilateralis CBS 781.70]
MSGTMGWAMRQWLKRETEDADPDETGAGQKEIFASWSLFILIGLLIIALFTSYVLQTRRIQAVHETVISIFAGMVVGLILRLTAVQSVLGAVSFDYQFFFNLLLPPIILASGYELHQGNFFRNIGTILTFAFAGTFISAMVLGVILWLWTRIGLDGMDVTFVETMSVGATLSATDPVTILAIFNTYKVDPKLYTVIFGESILNDAIAIVLFETAQKYKEGAQGGKLTVFSLFESIGVFLLVFFGSLVIGLVVGMMTSLMLKFTMVRRFPKIESCLVILVAYASYFLSNAIHMSGIVSLLFCGICMKHYAYHNMSRRTQLTTKFIFQVMAQLSENFIFIYLGLSLFTETTLEYKPMFILVTVVGICVARWCSVFPLSKAINWFLRYRARRQGREDTADELPFAYQAMLFWAGLRGAVGVALAAGLTGPNGTVLRATVLVVVVLTVIIFGGTTARMLEILGIRTGVVEEIDSDDEFDIEVVTGGTYSRRQGAGFGHTPRASNATNGFPLSPVDAREPLRRNDSYSSGHINGNRRVPASHSDGMRRSSPRNLRTQDSAEQALLSPGDSGSNDDDDDADGLDLPPTVRRSPLRNVSPLRSSPDDHDAAYPTSGAREHAEGHFESAAQRVASATGAMGRFVSGLSEDPAAAFRQIDEGFIKPHLLLDPGKGGGPSGGSPV